ncbi:carbohydrate ABC transporter permease [Paenibacillus sp. NPDC058071]|uniref:carbohydrate ABC transporter permease n=1 Tax=Paenibacillus sp. NPDC058071 TaxID=3346326 RepID=UPI0036D960F4
MGMFDLRMHAFSRKLSGYLLDAALVASAGLMAMPFFWMISTSLKSGKEVFRFVWLPARPVWENYMTVFESMPFLTYMGNSLFVTAVSAIGGTAITVFAAFAFAKLHFYGKKTIFALFIASMFLPEELLLLPNYLTAMRLGWIDRYEAMIVPWLTNGVSVFMLVQHFSSIPRQYDYAARADGVGPFYYLTKVLLPLSVPVIHMLMMLKAIASWNAFMWPVMVTNRVEMRTLQAGLQAFSHEAGTAYELLMAASVMTVLPIIILFGLLSKRISLVLNSPIKREKRH